MAPRSNFMADIAQMANGAASAFGGMREEVDNLIRQRMERSLNARGRGHSSCAPYVGESNYPLLRASRQRLTPHHLPFAQYRP